LLPIRTANYALLTEVAQAGFYRVVGGFPEASSFASMTIGCLGFAFAYWKITKSPGMLLVTIVLLLLLLLSTSSTAYGTLALAAVPLSVTLLHSLLIGRLSRANAYVVAMGVLVIAAGLCLYLYDSRIFDPFVRLFETTVLNKQNSSSGKERAYWNAVSLQALADTGLLGVGMGSSRTSSWAIAVLCQLGVPGAIFVLLMIGQLARGTRAVRRSADLQMVALHNGARASALCLLTAAAVSAGTADPGIQVFIALGVVGACRRRLSLDLEGRPVRSTPGDGGDGFRRATGPATRSTARRALTSPPVRA
jgi:hypothetical protein